MRRCSSSSAPPTPAGPRGWPVVTSISAAVAVQQGHRARRQPRGDGALHHRGVIDPEAEKIHAYCTDSVEHFDWLESLGLEFERSLLPWQGRDPAQHRGPPCSPATRRSGRSRTWLNRRRGTIKCPSPATPAGVDGDRPAAGRELERLGWRSATRRGPQSDRRRRERSGGSGQVDDGRVVGCGGRPPRGEGFIRAKAVVIAAGGFVMNPEMVARYITAAGGRSPSSWKQLRRRSGYRMGESVGAKLKHGVAFRDRPWPTRRRSFSTGSSSTKTDSG